MARISQIDPASAPAPVREAIARHLAAGHQLPNEKRTLLHNLAAFNAVEAASYDLDDELQRLIGKLDGDIFEYAVSAENECLVCTAYFSRLLRREHGIDPAAFQFSPRQSLLIEYARAIVRSPKDVSEDLFSRLRAEFSRDNDPEAVEEILVALTAMGVMMIANNYLNDILQIDP